jgi:dTDP-4-dehydrorhamnose reductase
MLKIGVTGYAGHVGQELMRYENVTPLACDVCDPNAVDLSVRNVKPDIIVHLASISDVDVCEKPENEKRVKSVNVIGTFNVAEVAEKRGCGMVIMSSAHVFDGRWGNYKEKSKPNPKNFYGFSKMAAEAFRSIFPFMKVVRTSYLFDYERVFKHLYPLRANQSFMYPTFIERSFMYLPHFAEAFYCYLQNYDRMPNMLHISGASTVSWYEFIRDMADVYKLDSSKVQPRSKEIKMDVAPRPYSAGLNIGLSKKLDLPQFGYKEGLLEMREISR